MKARVHGARLLARTAIAVSLAIGVLAAGRPADAAGTAAVGLGTAAPFAVLAGTPAITSTGATSITGDVGISPAAAVTGFPPGTVHGAIHKADAVALKAKSDLVVAYVDAAGRPVTATHGNLGGLTLVSGVYNAGGVKLDLTGTLTLDGQNNPNAVWVFQATSSLVTASSSTVKLINGANPCNVFWQVTSSATLGSGSTFVGTIMALTSITMASGVKVNGRALARNGEVTLIDDTIKNACSTSPTPTGSAPATSKPSPAASPTQAVGGATAGTSVPPTATLTPTDASGSGPSMVVLVGILASFLLAIAVLGRRRSLLSVRARRTPLVSEVGDGNEKLRRE